MLPATAQRLAEVTPVGVRQPHVEHQDVRRHGEHPHHEAVTFESGAVKVLFTP